jgi:6-pyruvoyl-tetrahydropterin synthase
VAPGGEALDNPNSWSANPVCAGVGAYFEVTVHVHAPPDATSGMVWSIHHIDDLVRSRFAPAAGRSLLPGGPLPAAVLREFIESIGSDEPMPDRVDWHLNPRLRYSMRPNAMHEVLIAHQYQFAASHRLHAPALDETENERLFGKCCRESGHGHNYIVEVDVAAPIDGPFSRHQMDEIVESNVIERFDHKHLNIDCPEFADRCPTVEHITIVCHDLLVEPIARAGARLRQVRVWETQKTWSAFPVEPASC